MVILPDVITNLERTSARKENLLASVRAQLQAYDDLDDQGDGWLRATFTAEFLEINLEELNKILKDLKDIK